MDESMQETHMRQDTVMCCVVPTRGTQPVPDRRLSPLEPTDACVPPWNGGCPAAQHREGFSALDPQGPGRQELLHGPVPVSQVRERSYRCDWAGAGKVRAHVGRGLQRPRRGRRGSAGCSLKARTEIPAGCPPSTHNLAALRLPRAPSACPSRWSHPRRFL